MNNQTHTQAQHKGQVSFEKKGSNQAVYEITYTRKK
jgi:hypothetical protein